MQSHRQFSVIACNLWSITTRRTGNTNALPLGAWRHTLRRWSRAVSKHAKQHKLVFEIQTPVKKKITWAITIVAIINTQNITSAYCTKFALCGCLMKMVERLVSTLDLYRPDHLPCLIQSPSCNSRAHLNIVHYHLLPHYLKYILVFFFLSMPWLYRGRAEAELHVFSTSLTRGNL